MHSLALFSLQNIDLTTLHVIYTVANSFATRSICHCVNPCNNLGVKSLSILFFFFFYWDHKSLADFLINQNALSVEGHNQKQQLCSRTGAFCPHNRKFVSFDRAPNAIRWKRPSKRLRAISLFRSPFWARIWRSSTFYKGQRFWPVYWASPGSIATRETTSRRDFGIQRFKSR